jgi:hypothetical protein
MSTRAVVLALTWLGGVAGHHSGDYLVQLDLWARAKQQRTGRGRRALVAHCVSYAATLAVTKAFAYRVAGVRVPLEAQLFGALTEGLLHGLIDDGRLLRRFADATGHQRFHDLADHGVNGRMLMDQAAHLGIQLPISAAVTTFFSERGER